MESTEGGSLIIVGVAHDRPSGRSFFVCCELLLHANPISVNSTNWDGPGWSKLEDLCSKKWPVSYNGL